MTLLTQKKKYFKKTVLGFFVVGGIFTILIFSCVASTSLREEKVEIQSGDSMRGVLEQLESEQVISSSLCAQAYMRLKKIHPKSGVYLFKKGEHFLDVLHRIASAQYGNVYVSVTISEGSTNEQIISLLKKPPLSLDENSLRKLMDKKEGYLFPDTYSFLPGVSEKDVIQELEDTFLKKMEEAEKGKTRQEDRSALVTMASIIEKEAANDLQQKQMISGILWKRIDQGMPLQVDAPFLYERGKGSAQLSRKDLREDSAYNTYTNRGLPPTPIGNPGYDALYAAAHPLESNYLFYLHGFDGKIHYAKKYQEHVTNKRKYLQ